MTRFIISAATLLLISSVLTANAFAGGVTAITECGAVLSKPGKYELTQDLMLCPEVIDSPPWAAITISSSHVRLNLKGHTITCKLDDETEQPHLFPGILVLPGSSHVRIKNGIVSGCTEGVELWDVSKTTVRNMTISDSRRNSDFYSGMGINVFGGSNNIIARNRIFGNFGGIALPDGNGHRVRKNIVNENFDIGIRAARGQNTKFVCNQANRNGFAGITLIGMGGDNVVRGNVANENGLGGISMTGFAMPGDPPVIVEPIPEGNRISGNIALDNGLPDLGLGSDLSEPIFIPADGSSFVEPTCRNTWKKNQFDTTFGPDDLGIMCIGTSVELDDDDICALEDDD